MPGANCTAWVDLSSSITWITREKKDLSTTHTHTHKRQSSRGWFTWEWFYSIHTLASPLRNTDRNTSLVPNHSLCSGTNNQSAEQMTVPLAKCQTLHFWTFSGRHVRFNAMKSSLLFEDRFPRHFHIIHIGRAVLCCAEPMPKWKGCARLLVDANTSLITLCHTCHLYSSSVFSPGPCVMHRRTGVRSKIAFP